MTHDQPPVAVAVSGGADSLYALLRLRESGVPVFALHGIFLRPSPPGEPRDKGEPDGGEALRRRLALACAEIGVSLHLADLSAEFLRDVIRAFARDYAAGLTPNPCALCNARLKFGLLLDKALALGAGRLATGHYARLLHTPGDEYGPALLQAADPVKDQSYFLALTPRKRLAAALFPLWDIRKRDTLAALAGRSILPPQPEESQDVCFVPDGDYRAFLLRAVRALDITLPGPGPLLLTDGRRLGEHKGLWRYTEGQRRGLGLGWKEPLRVIAKRSADNALIVGPKEELRAGGCLCAGPNILLPPAFWPETVLVKTRYRERPRAARALLSGTEKTGETLRISFLEADSAVAPGQVAAVYIPFCPADEKGNFAGNLDSPLRLVAGGVIGSAFRAYP